MGTSMFKEENVHTHTWVMMSLGAVVEGGLVDFVSDVRDRW